MFKTHHVQPTTEFIFSAPRTDPWSLEAPTKGFRFHVLPCLSLRLGWWSVPRGESRP